MVRLHILWSDYTILRLYILYFKTILYDKSEYNMVRLHYVKTTHTMLRLHILC